MASIDTLMAALTDTQIAQAVGNPHDAARMAYRVPKNTADSFPELEEIIGDYYAYHFSRCSAPGSRLSRVESVGSAKQLLERFYHRQRHGDMVTAYHDANTGTNGGVRGLLDVIADAMKEEAIEKYVRHVFDSQVAPIDYEQRVELIRQFMQRYGSLLSPAVRDLKPEYFAHQYIELVRMYAEAITRTASVFRRA